jgi:hypothetical protein
VGEVLARELQWSRERLALELSRFAEEAAAEGIAVTRERAEDVRPAGSPQPSAMP